MIGPFTVEDSTPADLGAIDHLLDLGFGLGRRVKTSYRLREGSSPVPGLSLVIRDKALGVVGAISFWPLAIGEQGSPALLLGPLAVHPARQNIGVGRALMGEGLWRARTKGHALVLLVGDQPYYGRMGFNRVPEGLLDLPGPFDPKRLLYLELTPGALRKAKGMALAPHRFAEISAALAIPHGGDREEECCEA